MKTMMAVLSFSLVVGMLFLLDDVPRLSFSLSCRDVDEYFSLSFAIKRIFWLCITSGCYSSCNINYCNPTVFFNI